MKVNKTCSIPGCNKKYYSTGLCRSHYNKTHKNVLAEENDKKCSVEGCLNRANLKGLCEKHYNYIYLKEYQPKYKERNRDTLNKYNRTYSKTERGKENKKKGSQRRRARKLGAAIVETFTSQQVFERDFYICCICGLEIDKTLHHPEKLSASLEHKIPLSRGGDHSLENCASAHLLCNLRKNSKLIEGNFIGANI